MTYEERLAKNRAIFIDVSGNLDIFIKIVTENEQNLADKLTIVKEALSEIINKPEATIQ